MKGTLKKPLASSTPPLSLLPFGFDYNSSILSDHLQEKKSKPKLEPEPEVVIFHPRKVKKVYDLISRLKKQDEKIGPLMDNDHDNIVHTALHWWVTPEGGIQRFRVGFREGLPIWEYVEKFTFQLPFLEEGHTPFVFQNEKRIDEESPTQGVSFWRLSNAEKLVEAMKNAQGIPITSENIVSLALSQRKSMKNPSNISSFTKSFRTQELPTDIYKTIAEF